MPKSADPSKSVAHRVAQFEKSDQQLRDHRRNAALRESRTDEKGNENDQQPQTSKSNQKTNAEKNTPDAIPSQNACSSPNGKSKRHKTKWIQKTTPQPNRETKEAVNDDIVINTQLHYNEKPMVDYAKLSEKRNKSFTFIPMEDLETHQTTNIVVNDPNGNSPSQLHQDLQDEEESINSNLKTTVYTPTTLQCYQTRTSSLNFTNNLIKYILGAPTTNTNSTRSTSIPPRIYWETMHEP